MVSSRRKPKFTAIDLFSGCGGVTVGLRSAGFRVLAAVENAPAALKVYRDNHRRVELFGDIVMLNALSLKRKLGLRKGSLDLLVGCPPCQGFSTLTTRNGHWDVADERNNLINHFGRLVEELLPRTVMMENVPGLGSDRRFTKFCGLLGKLGYDFDWSVVNAADYGVPQRRRRLVLLASRFGSIAFPDAEPERHTVREAIAHLPTAGRSGDAIHDLPEQRSEKVRRIIKLIPKDGGSRTDLPRSQQLRCHRKSDGFKDIYGRMAWDDVSPTITSGCFNPSKGRFLHPVEDRCITMREAALLQSFPDNYRFDAAVGKQTLASLIGNALPPELVRRFALEVRKHLNAHWRESQEPCQGNAGGR